jgi:hypothetical protein
MPAIAPSVAKSHPALLSFESDLDAAMHVLEAVAAGQLPELVMKDVVLRLLSCQPKRALDLWPSAGAGIHDRGAG